MLFYCELFSLQYWYIILFFISKKLAFNHKNSSKKSTFYFTLATEPLLQRKAPSYVGAPHRQNFSGGEREISCFFIQYHYCCPSLHLVLLYIALYYLLSTHAHTHALFRPRCSSSCPPLPNFRREKSQKF